VYKSQTSWGHRPRLYKLKPNGGKMYTEWCGFILTEDIIMTSV